MSRPIQFNNHPFRFLLYLEWILLTLAISTSMLPEHSPRLASKFPELTIGCLIVFGLMGLRLPTSNQKNKIIYTAIEILLLLLIGLYGGKTARLFPFLYLILVTRSCLIFQLYGRLVVTGMSFALFLITLNARSPRRLQPQDIEKFRFFTFNTALLFGLSLLFVLLLMNTVLSERQSREKLAIANEQLRQYALRIENQATLEERNRIAREIHDSLGHSLTALNLQLETALKLWQSNPTKAQVFLARAKELGSKALKDVRQSVSAMRTNPLQDKSLAQAIAILLDDFHRAHGVIPISRINIDNPPPTEINIAVYRIIQESLTNISKYANATEIILELTTTKNSLYLMIQDNGRGFDIQQNTTGFGLQSMRDRTLALGGDFNINSNPGSGCQITVELPLPRFMK
ncbi:sensor histidine kinase [Nostoc sp. FACHB-152]|uniref:sensor histidine kinase n=1 Tax=unclassified Nostoc TaxID=2593658 RepID=UPI0016842FBE|nr:MULTISPECIES: sensor histidine kinase [unclassified Nostoc]MBD2446050.1 sensor histidine kinase [Nostoc sp. FACHB-152]MBD2467282.1 sensor histidine kinase [Nostoc sp. FACHB-145]